MTQKGRFRCALYDAKPEPKMLWVVPGVGHALSYKTYQAEYTKKVHDFLETPSVPLFRGSRLLGCSVKWLHVYPRA